MTIFRRLSPGWREVDVQQHVQQLIPDDIVDGTERFRSLHFLRVEHPTINSLTFACSPAGTARVTWLIRRNSIVIVIPELATLRGRCVAVRITNQGAFGKAEFALWHDGHIGGHEIDMLGTEMRVIFRNSFSVLGKPNLVRSRIVIR